MLRLLTLFFIFISLPFFTEAKVALISTADVNPIMTEIMKAHATHKSLNTILIKRILQNYIEELDPTKTYFIEPDIHQWLDPSEEDLNKILQEYQAGNFEAFEEIHSVLIRAIDRHRRLEEQISLTDLPTKVKPEEFRKMTWTTNEEDLLTRLKRIKALQLEAASKLPPDVKDKSLQRIAKRQAKFEEDVLTTDPNKKQSFIATEILKASASALDTHTSYFTPEEANQFIINVQQRLFGIGAQLRDDINGFTVVKIIDGGPAAKSKEIKAKDRIIAVNGEPVVGMDIVDAVELIRGEKNTPVKLTIIRPHPDGDDKKDEKLDITIMRDEVVLKDTRFESNYEPYGDGGIAYLKLYTFYQDPDSSSGEDLGKALKELKRQYKIKGVVLDLRDNSGGMLSQAVSVTGLFITKGVVVSIKDDAGKIQHLRVVEDNIVWDGPLIVLINRASASASEIVAQTLQDYGRAIIVGDDHSYGKGTFQTFTLNATAAAGINPKGEYKVTRGKYYTVSGHTPQLTGVISDIVVPGYLSETEIGEKFSKYPLDNDRIPDSFDDDLSDIPFYQRDKIKVLYKFNMQQRLETYLPYIHLLKSNSELRLKNNKPFQTFLKDLKKLNTTEDEEPPSDVIPFDFQLNEAYNIMRDLIYLMPKD
jgi:carboxyl-terminal processing protease